MFKKTKLYDEETPSIIKVESLVIGFSLTTRCNPIQSRFLFLKEKNRKEKRSTE